jgi:uroporphyrinogen-III synthase
MSRTPRYLLTRPVGDADALAGALRRAGIESVVVPAIAIRPPVSYDALDRALNVLETYDWVLFTSPNGVRAMRGRIKTAAPGTPPPAWAAVGPGTAREVEGLLGAGSVWAPTTALGQLAASELPAPPGARVLWVKGDRASPEVGRRLRERGLVVDDVVAYRTAEAPPESVGPLAAAWRDGLDGVVFASASAARGFAGLARAAGIVKPERGFLVVAIGPVTAAAAVDAGWPPRRVAGDHSVAGIVEVIVEESGHGAASV